LHSYLPNTYILIYRIPAFLIAEISHCYLPFTAIPQKGDPRYITRSEAAELLKNTLPTLNRYKQLGIIKGFRIGTRVLYKIENIEEDVKCIAMRRNQG
jgi:hypothetical protein